MPIVPADWHDRIGRRIRLRDLHIFFAVVHSGSMARAANHLSVSQPVVSQAIADLEAAVGVRVLERGPRGATPTVYGEVLLKRGLESFDALHQGVRDIEFLSDPMRGEIRVGSQELLNSGLMPALVERVARELPEVVVRVQPADQIWSDFRELYEREVDVSVVLQTKPLSADLERAILFEERLCVVAAASSKWARRRRINTSDLATEPWALVPADSDVGPFTTNPFRAIGIEPPQARVVGYSHVLRLHLVATGRYLAILPRSVVGFNMARFDLVILPVKLEFPARPVAIVSLRSRTKTPLVRRFIELAKAECILFKQGSRR
jgi:DNA-binding transcriptional LysR family regulator